MKAVKKSLLNLFEPKVDEFSQRRLEMSLSSIADISKTWETLNPQNKPESLIIKRGSDLMIGCFIDLERLGLLTQESLSNFLNRDNRGKLIASYVKSRYPTLTLTTAYLNFNLKLSLIHSSYTKQMAKLLEGPSTSLCFSLYSTAVIELLCSLVFRRGLKLPSLNQM
jgi:hypothetical protein